MRDLNLTGAKIRPPRLEDLTGLGRHIDPRLRSNQTAILVSGLAGLVVAVVDLFNERPIDIGSAIAMAMSVFLTWAIARELDPDNPKSATLGMLFTLVVGLLPGVEVIGAVVVLLAVRLLVGSVGTRLKLADYLVLAGVAGIAGTRPELWPAAGLLALAALIGRPSGNRIASATLALAALIGALGWGTPPELNLYLSTLAITSFAALAAIASLPTANVVSRADSGDHVISTTRVAAARVATGLTIATSAILAPGNFATVVPLLGALASVAIVSFIDRPAAKPDFRGANTHARL